MKFCAVLMVDALLGAGEPCDVQLPDTDQARDEKKPVARVRHAQPTLSMQRALFSLMLPGGIGSRIRRNYGGSFVEFSVIQAA